MWRFPGNSFVTAFHNWRASRRHDLKKGGGRYAAVREEVHWHWLGSIQKLGHHHRHFHNDCVKLQRHWESNKPPIATPFFTHTPLLSPSSTGDDDDVLIENVCENRESYFLNAVNHWWINIECISLLNVFSVTNAGKLVERLPSGDLPTVLFFSIDLYGFSLKVSPHNVCLETQVMTFSKN